MGGKHLKRMRAEKSKVQLKKRKLAKNQNITDTSFKVKKIVTIEQLKKIDENEPVWNRYTTLKDLLTHLDHYNFTARLNGLTGIKEILTKHPEILLGPLLKPVITKLLERIVDEEYKIRTTAVNLISYVLTLVPHSLVVPFHDILQVHLACAMTHRNTSIQKDSLKFVDVIINHSPEALKSNLQMITQNFIRIIKTFVYGTHVGGFSTNKPKQNLEQARTEVLVRFYKFLAAYYSNNNVTESDVKNIKINPSESLRISLRDSCNSYKTVPDLPDLFKRSENKGKIVKETEVEAENLKSLCLLVMPVLFDIWTEFSPSQLSSKMSSGCYLTETEGELLCSLLIIILLLSEKVGSFPDSELDTWFILNYCQSFKKLFMSRFPYFPSVTERSKSSNCSELKEDPLKDYLLQNLITCYLFYTFRLFQKNKELVTKVEDYIISVLMKKSHIEPDGLVKVMDISIRATCLKKSKIFDLALTTVNTTNNSRLQRGLIELLTALVLEESEYLLEDCGVENWVTSLPKRLRGPEIYACEIETILQLIIRPTGSNLLRQVERRARKITKNLPNIKITGGDEFEGQRKIATILYRCREKVLSKIIEKKILNNASFPEDLRNYILYLFYRKLGKQPDLSNE